LLRLGEAAQPSNVAWYSCGRRTTRQHEAIALRTQGLAFVAMGLLAPVHAVWQRAAGLFANIGDQAREQEMLELLDLLKPATAATPR
jgi:hypothetical protein